MKNLKEIYPSGVSILLVERIIECPDCDRLLKIGDVLYEDKFRSKVFCPYCSKKYENKIICN